MTTDPRLAAFFILARIDKEHSYADILLDRELSHGGVQGADRGLLTELVYGVLRRMGTLDHVISRFSKIKPDRLERTVLILLRLGLYQLLFLDRIPSSAAVNETVKLAHKHASRATGFINAVLREADRKRDSIPYPDRDRDPVGFLAARHSHPKWIIEGWITQLGLVEAEQLAAVMSDAPPQTIRVNTLRISREELAKRLSDEGATALPARYSPIGAYLTSPVPFSTLPSFHEGLFSVQDEASQIVALLSTPKPGERVVDLCAAPGGKTACMAELMGNKGIIVACDINKRRLEQVTMNINRLGIGIVETRQLDAEKPGPEFLGERFDRVLLDAPCSGMGVLRRNPEGKWWRKPEDILELAGKQKSILKSAARFVKKDGILLYAVCSTAEKENEEVVDDFLSQNDDFVVENVRDLIPEFTDLCSERGFLRTWPNKHAGMDGFFAARLRRQS